MGEVVDLRLKTLFLLHSTTFSSPLHLSPSPPPPLSLPRSLPSAPPVHSIQCYSPPCDSWGGLTSEKRWEGDGCSGGLTPETSSFLLVPPQCGEELDTHLHSLPCRVMGRKPFSSFLPLPTFHIQALPRRRFFVLHDFDAIFMNTCFNKL